MLEGKELEGKIGDIGTYGVDLTDKGMVIGEAKAAKKFGKYFKFHANVSCEGDVVEGLKALAQKSGNTLVIGAINTLATMLGR